MNPADRNSLHRLLSSVVDGTATQSDMDDLSAILARSAEARRFYIRYLDMQADLMGGRGFESKPSRRFPWVAAVAGGLFAASLALAVWPVRTTSTETLSPPRAYVATVTACMPGAILNGAPVAVGMRLAPGPFRQDAGSVNVQFDGGAQILFESPATFTIESRRAISIDQATFVFQGNQTCESISISTPHSVLTDIGTRYAAVVAAGAEELHVADGSVRRTTRDRRTTGNHELLEQGEGRRYCPKSPEGAEIPLDVRLVDRKLPETAAAVGKRAGPFAWDDFRMTPRQLPAGGSGAGWIDAWVGHTAFPDLRVTAQALDANGSGAVLHDGQGWTAAHRRLEQPIDLSRDGVFYVRYLFRRGPRPAAEPHLAMLVLRTYGLTTEQEIEAQSLLQFAVLEDDIATIRFSGRSSRSSLPQSPDQTYAAVAKIVAGRTNPDQIFFRIMSADQLSSAAESVDWSVASESLETDLVFDQVSLEFVSRGQIEFDDLCIGPTWESVTRPIVAASR